MIIISQEQIDSFKRFLDSHESFIIAGHKEPDGDCIASCLGLSYILDSLNKPFTLINAGPFKRSEVKKFEPLFVNTVPFMTQTERKECALLVADCSEIERIGDIEGDLGGLDTFVVDHHRTADVGGTGHIIDPTSPAASCLVQQLFEAIVGKPTRAQAEIFFFGLATDSGFFQFLGQDSKDVFVCASRLVAAGVSPKKIHRMIASGKQWNTRKLLGVMLAKSERYLDGKLVVACETQEETAEYGADGRDSDSYYSLMLEVEGVEAVLLVRQDTDFTCTLGFRSKDSCDVSAIAAKFGGGGHKNAAGASTEGRIETVLPQVIKEFAKKL